MSDKKKRIEYMYRHKCLTNKKIQNQIESHSFQFLNLFRERIENPTNFPSIYVSFLSLVETTCWNSKIFNISPKCLLKLVRACRILIVIHLHRSHQPDRELNDDGYTMARFKFTPRSGFFGATRRCLREDHSTWGKDGGDRNDMIPFSNRRRTRSTSAIDKNIIAINTDVSAGLQFNMKFIIKNLTMKFYLIRKRLM